LLKKKVKTENISKTVKFLIGNDNITGQIIPVDSGQSIAWLTPDIINIKE
jgi:enoyl-[acyl-carrier-protein] reductase (NADH)